MTTLKVNGGSSGGNNSDHETPVDPGITDCTNPKECTIPNRLLDHWVDHLPAAGPANSNLADCTNPKECTIPGAVPHSLLSSWTAKPEDKTPAPDVTDCTNPKECTIPTARASGAR